VTSLHAEWTKLRTLPGTWWLLLAVVATTVAVSALAAGSTPGSAAPGVDTIKLSLTGVQLAQSVVAILGVLSVGGEYGSGMIQVSVAAVPRRARLLAAKATVVSGAVVVAATFAVLGSLLAARCLMSFDAVPLDAVPPGSLPLGALPLGALPLDALPRPAAGSVLYLVLIGVLSVGVGAAVRNPAAAVGVVLGLLYLFPILATAIDDEDWQRRLDQVSPMSAGLAVQTTVGLDKLPIGPWPGLGVLAAWAAVAMFAGAWVLHRDLGGSDPL
jgi:ABC-2 type transport system permease protein